MDESAAQEPMCLGEEFLQDPPALYRRLQPDGSARPVSLPNKWPGWLATSYEDVRGLLADPRVSKDFTRVRGLFPPGTGLAFQSALIDNMLTTDPPDHTRLRRLVTKAFTVRAVDQLRPRIEQAADELLDAIQLGSAIDLLDAYALPLPITVICELLGVPTTDQRDFRSWSMTFFTMSAPEEVAEANRWLTAYLTGLIAEKKANPADDLLSELIQVSDEGSTLSPGETLSMAFLLLFAGFETTVNLIANGVLALLNHPDQLALLRSAPSLLPNAIEEILRFDGPVHIATIRASTEPIPAGGTEIPADKLIFASLLAANRDDDHFPDPDRFDITRETAGHLAFGRGIHRCVGAPLARLEGRIAIGRLLDRFPGIALNCDLEELSWRESTLMHGLNSLPVRLDS